MASIAALGNAEIMGIRLGKALNNLPCAVLAAVIDKKHPAFGGDFFLGSQILKLGQELGRGQGQDCLLVITGNDDI